MHQVPFWRHMTKACANTQGYYSLKEELEKAPKDSDESGNLQKEKDNALKDSGQQNHGVVADKIGYGFQLPS